MDGIGIVKRGAVKKLILIIITLLITINALVIQAQASLQVWPPKITIDIDNYDSKEEISFYIEARNPYRYPVNASTRVENPTPQAIKEGCTNIPDPSWFNVTPKTIYTLPGSTAKFKVSLNLPEKPLYYNESWETRITIFEDSSPKDAGGFMFKTEISVRIFVNTPPGEKASITKPLYFLIFIIIALLVTLLVFFYAKKLYSADQEEN